jgi:hypothetical protein
VTLPGEAQAHAPGAHKRQHFHVTAEERGGASTIELTNSRLSDQSVCFSIAALEPIE